MYEITKLSIEPVQRRTEMLALLSNHCGSQLISYIYIANQRIHRAYPWLANCQSLTQHQAQQWSFCLQTITVQHLFALLAPKQCSFDIFLWENAWSGIHFDNSSLYIHSINFVRHMICFANFVYWCVHAVFASRLWNGNVGVEWECPLASLAAFLLLVQRIQFLLYFNQTP